jgi:hypothetical protein
VKKAKELGIWGFFTIVVVLVVLIALEQRREDEEHSIWRSSEALMEASLTQPTAGPGLVAGCYEVQAGDSFGSIAQRFLGDARYYGFVMKINGRNPNTGDSRIYIGDVLWVKGVINNSGMLFRCPED